MHELIYTSVASWEMESNELRRLLRQSRTKNRRLDVTGILAYYRREFMQLLEGDQAAIFELYEIIRRDDRHTSVKLFWDGAIEERSFAGWSMAFINLDDADPSTVKGYSRFLQDGISGLNATGSESTGKELLLYLRDSWVGKP